MSAVKTLQEHGCKSIKFVCLLAAPEGIKAFSNAFPDIDVYTAVIDDHLNEHCYIVPGLGDAGDRLFGTR
ncbi:Uracil phosphoribosyltransferase [bioreactor metagenome]|uniref:Uracil phosphoribosyltransferase n=1 Tax=bioreactor metagenome TaxID=1076179 RepID=A0A645G7Q9_9ZZZZ